MSDTERPPDCVRLACRECARDDMDGITPGQLEAALAAGWQNVSEFQSYEESCRTYELHETPPPGYSVLDWYTHIGLCPRCAAEEDARANERTLS
jgi:hypothetical protein